MMKLRAPNISPTYHKGSLSSMWTCMIKAAYKVKENHSICQEKVEFVNYMSLKSLYKSFHLSGKVKLVNYMSRASVYKSFYQSRKSEIRQLYVPYIII